MPMTNLKLFLTFVKSWKRWKLLKRLWLWVLRVHRLYLLLQLFKSLVIDKWFVGMISGGNWIVQNHWFTKHQSISHRSFWGFNVYFLNVDRSHLLLFLAWVPRGIDTRSLIDLENICGNYNLMMPGSILCALCWHSIVISYWYSGLSFIIFKWFSKIKLVDCFLIMV